MSDDSYPEIGKVQLDAVLRYLPIFESPDYQFGEWHGPEGQFPFFVTSRDVDEFVQTLYDQEIIVIFDWMSWGEEVDRYSGNPSALEAADLVTVRKLFTAHVRAERFSEGHLAEVLESGHIASILRRMKRIRDQLYNQDEV